MYEKILFIQSIVENGWGGGAYAAYPTSSPGCIITKDGLLNFKRGVLNQKCQKRLKQDCCKEVKGMFSGKTVKRYLNVSGLALF